MTVTIWKLICFVLLPSCLMTHPTPNHIIGHIDTNKPATVMWKFEGESFGISCPSNWTLTRNTYKEVGSKCGIDWGRRESDTFCHVRYLYPWNTGVYWCESDQGVISNVVNLTVTKPSASARCFRTARSMQQQANTTAFVQKFRKERFFMSCPDDGEWVVMRNTSNRGRSHCNVPGAKPPACIIGYPSPCHQGIYWCENKEGAVANLLSFTMTEGSLLLQPSAVPIVEGDDVFLTCRTLLHAAVNPKALVRFYKDDVLIGERSGRRMSIHHFSRAHAGLYKCTIETLSSSAVRLEAKERKTIAMRPADNATETPLEPSASKRLRSGSLTATLNGVPVKVNHLIAKTGDNLILSCNDTTNASNAMTVWAIRDWPARPARQCGYGSWGIRMGHICNIACLYPFDGGLYFCQSDEGESEAPLGLNVTIAPSHVYSPSVVFSRPDVHLVMSNRGTWQVHEGEHIALYCVAKNCSDDLIIWTETRRGISQCGTDRGMLSDLACHITVDRENIGNYWCASKDGRRRSRTMALTVVGVVAVTMRVSTVPLTKGDDAALTCTLDSSDILPDTATVFYKDNEILSEQARGYMVIRNFTNALHRGYYKCEIPGHGESQYNLLEVVEPEVEICRLYDHSRAPAVTENPTTVTSTGITTLDMWGTVAVCVAVIPVVIALCVCVTAMMRWKKPRTWALVQEDEAAEEMAEEAEDAV